MRRVVSILLPFALAAFAASTMQGQRGGHGGGMVSHAGGGGGFHGGFSSGSVMARPSSSFFHAPASGFARMPGVRRASPWGNNGYLGGNRRPYGGGGRGRRLPYFYGYNSYLVPNLVGYPYPFGFGWPFDWDDYDDQPDQPYQGGAPQPEAYPGQAPYAYPGPQGAGPEAFENERPGSGYRPEYQAGSGAAQAAPQPATTLIFKDGRPSEQVHNYVLTATTLFRLDDGERQEIPISEINVPATVETNRSAGVDFSLPFTQ